MKEWKSRKCYSESWKIKIQQVDFDTELLSHFKVALSGLRQFLATENSLKMMKIAFYFT